jgi:hypothetical protein
VRGIVLPGQERVALSELDVSELGSVHVIVPTKVLGLYGSELRAICYHGYGGSRPNVRKLVHKPRDTWVPLGRQEA